MLTVVWGLLVGGASSAFAIGESTGGDGSSGVSISLIPPTSSAIQGADSGGGSDAGSTGDPDGAAPSTADSIRISLIPPTSSAIDGDASESSRSDRTGTQDAASSAPRVEVEAESRDASQQSTEQTVAPSATGSAPVASQAAGAGGDAGTGLPGSVSASGFGPLGSWLIGVAVAVLVGAAVVLAVARRRLHQR